MKKNFLIVMCLMMALMASAQDLVVCSYNIRNANRGDAKNGNGWEKRSVYMCQQIQFEDPGVFGCQEVKKEQIDDMLRLMPEYAYVGVGREDGKEGGEYSPVFYKKDRYKLLDSGTFWLAEDPTKAELGWDAACKRVCLTGPLQGPQDQAYLLFLQHPHGPHRCDSTPRGRQAHREQDARTDEEE